MGTPKYKSLNFYFTKLPYKEGKEKFMDVDSVLREIMKLLRFTHPGISVSARVPR